MRLCRCLNPTRNATDPERRLTCSACGGHTPRSVPPTVETVRTTCRDILGLLAAIQAAYVLEYPGLYLPTTHGLDGPRRRSGPADTTAQTAVSRAHADKRAWAATAWDRLKAAHDHLQAADAALGNIPLVDARHEPDTGPPGRWWEQRITANTPADQIPAARLDLREAHAALLRRQARGE